MPVIWGGTHPTIAPDESIQVADIVCIGEGEYPLLDLANRMSAQREFDYVKNLWIRKEDRIIKNDVGPLIPDLDTLPFPHYGDQNSRALPMNQSRLCMCGRCSRSAIREAS